MVKTLSRLKYYTMEISAIISMLIVQMVTDLSLPKYMAKIVDEGITNYDTNFIIRAGIIMIGITLVGVAASIIMGLYSAKLGCGFARDIRKDIFEKVETFSKYEIEKIGTASLITRTTNDVQQLQMLVTMMFRIALLAPLMGIGGLIMLLREDLSMSWIILISISFITVVLILIYKLVVPKFIVVQKLVDKLNLVAREEVSGVMTVRAFNAEEYEEKRFDEVNEDLTTTNFKINRIMILLMPAMNLLMSLTALAIIWLGSKHINEALLGVGDVMAFIQYANIIIQSFIMIGMAFVFLPRAIVSVRRINEVLYMEESIKDKDEAVEVEIKGEVKLDFRNVTFSYPGAPEPVLKDISFTINPGETVAFVGGTGSGKSSIINLILRFYDPNDGEILINDINIKDMTQNSLRKLMGYIPQKSTLFSGNLESNFKFANNNISKEEIDRALRISKSHDFVYEKEEGLDISVSEGGENFSGGQRQRLSIARALARNPKIYLFDDSFSALDFKTDKELREDLKKNIKDSIIIIVAQRINTIMDLDKIVVLENGKVEAIGNHKQLLKSSEVYKEIALTQFSEKELSI